MPFSEPRVASGYCAGQCGYRTLSSSWADGQVLLGRAGLRTLIGAWVGTEIEKPLPPCLTSWPAGLLLCATTQGIWGWRGGRGEAQGVPVPCIYMDAMAQFPQVGLLPCWGLPDDSTPSYIRALYKGQNKGTGWKRGCDTFMGAALSPSITFPLASAWTLGTSHFCSVLRHRHAKCML